MSDALKKLEEIEARRDVLSKLTFDNEHSGCPGDDPHGVMKIGGVRVAWIDDYGFDDAHQEAIEQAGGDLALLARLVRSVAEAPCARGCEDECDAAIAKGLRQAPPCHRCRIRRELSGGVR